MSVLASSSRLSLSPSSTKSVPPRISRSLQHARLPSSRSSSTTARSKISAVPRLGPRQVDAGSSMKGASSNGKLKGGKGDTLWQSWLNLTPTTRLLYGITVAVIAVGGLKLSDVLRAKMPPPGEEHGEGSTARKPKLLGFSVVDRKES